MKKVRWGIAGAGRIAGTFAADLPYSSNAELVAVAARSGESAASFAGKHGIPSFFAGYESMFAATDIDAVYIATPHTLHIEHAIQALGAGKAVMCEKPLTVNARECQGLIDAATDADVYTMEAMWTWFLPAIRKAHEWISEGRIGRLRHIKADFGYPQVYSPDKREYDATLAGGCLLEMGVYPVAIARYFTDRAPNSIAVRSRYAPNGVEDDVVMLFDYEDCVATLATSFRCKLQNWAYVIGTEGYIAIPDFWRANECYLYVLDERIESFNDGRAGSGFEFQIESVSEDILAGRKQSEVVPLSASLSFQQDMDRVRAEFDG
jgi:predicted dehydrogenase